MTFRITYQIIFYLNSLTVYAPSWCFSQKERCSEMHMSCVVVFSWIRWRRLTLFVFSSHKKYSCSFIKWQLNHWCHMDYFNDVLTTFLCLERGSSLAVYAGSESSQISSNTSQFVFQRWTKVLQVWNDMRVRNDSILTFLGELSLYGYFPLCRSSQI